MGWFPLTLAVTVYGLLSLYFSQAKPIDRSTVKLFMMRWTSYSLAFVALYVIYYILDSIKVCSTANLTISRHH